MHANDLERRKALVSVVFSHYTQLMPGGRPVCGALPPGFVEHMANSPKIHDLDRYLAQAVRDLVSR